MKKRAILFLAILWAFLALSGCGEKAGTEDGWYAKIHKLAVETVMEKYEDSYMIEDGTLEIVIDKIHPGSFTQEDANEVFLNCWFKGMPHIGGFDSRAGIILNADTLEVIAYKEFSDDEVMLGCPRTAKGQNRILCLSGSGSQGTRGQTISLWSVQDGRWEALPTGIADCVRYFKKDFEPFEVNENEFEVRIQNGWCYMDEIMASGHRLAVTCEYGLSNVFGQETIPPAELIAILVWDPLRERFELDSHTVQPNVQSKTP